MRERLGWTRTTSTVVRRRIPRLDGATRCVGLCLAGLKEGSCGFSLLLTAVRIGKGRARATRDRCEMDECGRLLSAGEKTQ